VAEPDGFDAFVVARSPALLRFGWLLTGNRATAEDLVQAALMRTWVRWGRLESIAGAEPYVRRVMVNLHANWWRRRWRGEVPTDALPDRADAGPDLELRESVRTALASLPRRQRAVIVLRYVEDLSVTETAAILGCTSGTVKSQTAKALGTLRRGGLLAPYGSEGVSR
jgi:RNA polymerase sigma-70 factor (sigma-E family)